MSKNLTISLVTICILVFLFVYSRVKKEKMLFKHALLWWGLDIILLISIFSLKYLRSIADIMGIQEISNMIFLFGFVVVLAICLVLTMNVAENKNKIRQLTQELGILENKIRGIDNEKNKKDGHK